jgi:mannitol-1-phosphate/altronate dehydrogenase
MPPHSQVLEFDQTLEQDMEEAFAKVTEKGANTSKSMDDSIFSNPLTLPDQSQSAYPTSMCNKEPRGYTSTFTSLIN